MDLEIFIKSLIECINETDLGKTKDFSTLNDFFIDLEYSTDGNGRIDILILGFDSAIIIENKIYHHLNNNLKDYWNTIVKNKNQEEKSIGIVLSLSGKESINHAHFIPLTHLILLNKVMANIGQYLLSSSDKYYIYLKDFYQNIINLSKKTMEKEELLFVLNHLPKINAVIGLSKSYKNFIKEEVDRACNQLEGFRLVPLKIGSSKEIRLRYYESEKVKGLCFTVLFSDLFNGKQSLSIYIEIWGEKD
ncbi:MAG: PD-(D/E)XK nuclease family protein [Bacteroidetes bacterium]|nr:PD-(D/E)XK nuclease family protein [Bacteroidota bacterium]